MIQAEDIINWLLKMPADMEVGVDENSLCLVSASGLWLKVGGMPEEDNSLPRR